MRQDPLGGPIFAAQLNRYPPKIKLLDPPLKQNIFAQAPTERTRLYFLLAWLHAIIQERLRYAPLGWSKHYEFSESDLRVACDTIDTWLDSSSQVSG